MSFLNKLATSPITSPRVKPETACYIGDHLHKDAIGASTAGLRGIWLNRKRHPVPEDIEAIVTLADFSAPPSSSRTTVQ